MIHVRYAIKHNGEIHDATICRTKQAAIDAGRVYVMDYGNEESHIAAPGLPRDRWKAMLATGEAELVRINCHEAECVKVDTTEKKYKPRRNGWYKYSKESCQLAFEMYGEGYTKKDIKKATGIPENSLFKMLVNRGYVLPDGDTRLAAVKRRKREVEVTA